MMTQTDLTQAQTRACSTGAERFNAWYVPHVRDVLQDWRSRHPIKHHCEPLRDDLHTRMEPSRDWDEAMI